MEILGRLGRKVKKAAQEIGFATGLTVGTIGVVGGYTAVDHLTDAAVAGSEVAGKTLEDLVQEEAKLQEKLLKLMADREEAGRERSRGEKSGMDKSRLEGLRIVLKKIDEDLVEVRKLLRENGYAQAALQRPIAKR